MLQQFSQDVRQYLLITANYWAFTLTDGALRMLVVLYFHDLGYSPLEIASLFLFYEFFGIVTNLLGGWLGARIGLNRTMNIGLALQLLALAMLLVESDALTVVWVMAAQALSGVAKDLNKMSAKSAIKLLIPDNAQSTLYHWVARLTGSKNALKGMGFFVGGALLMLFGFHSAIVSLLSGLTLVWLISLVYLKRDLGKANHKPKITQVFSKSSSINQLSAARLFLFAARDVWFVVALPVYFSSQFGWDHWLTGGFMAAWVMLYGIVQTQAPRLTGSHKPDSHRKPADGKTALIWVASLSLIPALISLSLSSENHNIPMNTIVLVVGLLVFGAVFAVNSSLHSFLIVNYASRDSVSMDVGFYYMANAAGRLLGTVLSGWLYQTYQANSYGLQACLWASCMMLIFSSLLSIRLPKQAT